MKHALNIMQTTMHVNHTHVQGKTCMHTPIPTLFTNEKCRKLKHRCASSFYTHLFELEKCTKPGKKTRKSSN